MAAQCGLTLAQAVEHSLAQLKLLAAASTRLEARRALLNLETTYAAMAGCWDNRGVQMLRRTRQALEKQAE